tara:strand:- start:96 stop:623 length:528 start_codon:yes stop_codon:yes gene_type:complete
MKNDKQYDDNDINEVQNLTCLDLLNFYSNNEKDKTRHCSKNYSFCECDFQNVINESSNPKKMRGFLIISNIVDRAFLQLLNPYYNKFRENFPLPRFESHSNRGNLGDMNLLPLKNLTDEEKKNYYRYNHFLSWSILRDLENFINELDFENLKISHSREFIRVIEERNKNLYWRNN